MQGNWILKFSYCKAICTIFVVLVVLRRARTCPLVCQCDDLNGQKYVQCDQVSFTTLPKEIPSDTELLFLSSTKITELTENYFSRLSNLETIELSNNQIANITNGVFNGLPKLKTLNLANNGIQRVSSNAFAGLTSLTKLSLSNNYLSSLPQNLIKDLTELETLNLDKNSLQTIPTGFLNNTSKLERLNLNSNNLTMIDNDLLQTSSKLNYLDLSSNLITAISDHAFKVSGASINFLSLGNNKLPSFPKALFDLTVPYGFLNLLLQDNSMTTIPQEAKSIFDKIKIGKIRLSGNPYICDSNLRWLQTWTSTSSLVKDIDDVTCATLNGEKSRLSEYDFNKTVSTTAQATTLAPTTSLQATSATATTSILSSSTIETTTISTTHAPMSTTPTQPASLTSLTSPRQQKQTTTTLFTSIATNNIMSEQVSSTQQLPGKVNSGIKLKKKHIILATCLSAAFIAIVVFVAMYCFRRKIIKRDKMINTRYDRVRVV